MRVNKLINDLSKEAETLPEVLAPVLPEAERKQKVIAVINNHPYRFTISPPTEPGWHILQPTSSWEAYVVREAYPFEIIEYLKLLPRLHCIAVRRFGKIIWLIYPFNRGDAKQRFVNLEFPRQAYLVLDNIQPFDVISCRIMGETLLYESTVPTLMPSSERLRAEFANETTPDKVKAHSPEFRSVYEFLYAKIQERKKAYVQGQIEDALAFLGAELVAFQERGEDYIVKWKERGSEREVVVSRDLRLISAGICLEGLEREQSLTSAVAVMRRYEERDD